ncbi:MAG: vanadium-dependent haloperoxidase [Bacteroidota bacterium]|nr:vanadium-dependent haloperoxidase [Bacteroidota bacterium]
MKTNLNYLFILTMVALLGVVGCKKDEPAGNNDTNLVSELSYDVIYDWNNLFLDLNKDALGYRPGPSPRALAYMSLAAYEVCIPGMPRYNSMRHQFPGLKLPEFGGWKDINWAIAVNESYAYLVNRLHEKVNWYPGHTSAPEVNAKIEHLRERLEAKYKENLSESALNNSKAWGQDIAKAMFDWASTDEYGHEAYLNPLNNDPSKKFYYDWKKNALDANGNVIPGKWHPTNDNPDGSMFPYWGKVRTFATEETQKLCRPIPIKYSEDPRSSYYNQAMDAYSKTIPAITYEDEWIAEFWSDDLAGLTFSPPTRLMAIYNQIMKLEDYNLEEVAVSVAKIGLTLNDCAVVCWNSKYHYNLERPESYIKRVIDPNWEPHLYDPLTGEKGITPSFPAYPSGHSTFGGGGGEVLAHIVGTDSYSFTDNCHKNRTEFNGAPRSFDSFSECGLENAYSRIPLGVHWLMDCTEGTRLGREVARRVIALPWEK